MSYAADQLSQAEQQAAEREAALWYAGCIVKDGLRSGEPLAREILVELQQIEKEKQ